MMLINAGEPKNHAYESEQWHESAVPVVRCRDCVYRDVLNYCSIIKNWVYDDFYCATGERNGGEQYMNISEDMTFCDDSDECKNKNCYRHKCHIKHFEIPHSYAHLRGTNECEWKDGEQK